MSEMITDNLHDGCYVLTILHNEKEGWSECHLISYIYIYLILLLKIFDKPQTLYIQIKTDNTKLNKKS